MLRRNFIIPVAVFAITITLNACSIINNPAKIKHYTQIETSQGMFIIGLYEGTPLHRQNFMVNCSNQTYDSTLIYSTAPNSIHKMGLNPKKKENYVLSRTTNNSKIENEIHSKLINKTGAVGMLQLLNDQNPEMKSNNFLFYIVKGMKMDKKLLNTLEAKKNAPIIADYITDFMKEPGKQHYDDSLKFYKTNKDKTNFRRLYLELTDSVKPRITNDGIELFQISDEQKKTYLEVGGVPIYDGQYTVFGEIVYGKDILSKLSDIKTGLYNKPRNDIYIISTKNLTKKEYKKLKKTLLVN